MCRTLSGQMLICCKSLYAADGPLCFIFSAQVIAGAAGRCHGNARLLDKWLNALFVLLAHPHLIHVPAVLLCLSPVLTKEHLHSHETPHLIRRLFTIRWVAYSLWIHFPHAHTHIHAHPRLISSGISDGSNIPNSGLMSGLSLFTRLACVSVCKDISIDIILSCSYFLWLNLTVFSFAYVCFVFRLFSSDHIFYLIDRSQREWAG